MTEQQAAKLIENTGYVRAKIDSIEGLQQKANGALTRHDGRLNTIEKDMVTDDNCHDRIKSIKVATNGEIKNAVEAGINKAMNGRKRSKALFIRDILLGLLGSGGIGSLIYFLVEIKGG